MWQQRSQIRWLSVGDKNTRFFHLRASQLRKKKNRITRLRKLDGQSMKDSHELRNLATTFYRDIYTSIGVGNMAAVLDIVSPKVTEIMNSKLIAPIDERQVKEVLFHMFPTKAPGLDSFPAHFFQRNWDLCGKEVTLVVLRMLKGEDDLTAINDMISANSEGAQRKGIRPIHAY